MVPSFLRFLQGYAVFENGDLPVAVAFVLGLLPICGAQDQVKQIVRGGRLGVQIDPAGLFLCQGGVGGDFDGGHRRTQRRAPPAQGVGRVMPDRPSLPPHFSPIFNLLTGRAQRRFASVRAMLFTPHRRQNKKQPGGCFLLFYKIRIICRKFPIT